MWQQGRFRVPDNYIMTVGCQLSIRNTDQSISKRGEQYLVMEGGERERISYLEASLPGPP